MKLIISPRTDAIISPPQCPPDILGDGIGDEAGVSVGESGVHSARMAAPRGGVPLGRIEPRRVDTGHVQFIVAVAGKDDVGGAAVGKALNGQVT